MDASAVRKPRDLLPVQADLGAKIPPHPTRHNLNAARNIPPTLYDWSDLARRFAAIALTYRDDRAYFFRHGETKYNELNRISGQHDTRLSSSGQRQAKRLRHELPNHIDLIVCSALYRAVETMELSVPAETRRKVPIYADRRLNEVSLGEWQGRRRFHVPQFEDGDLDFAPEGGESYRVAAHRVLSVIADIFDRLATLGASPRNAVVFCHAGVLRIIKTLIDPNVEPHNVFRTNLDNAAGLIVAAPQVKLPGFWGEGESGFVRNSGPAGSGSR